LLPYNDGGFYYHANVFEKIFKYNKIKTVFEVGSWFGKSTRHFAGLIESSGKVYAIDHWMGSPEHNIQSSQYQKIYEQFLSNVIHKKLEDKIVPVKLSSQIAAIKLGKLNHKPDLIYIDASHDFENVYNDLKAWYPFVRKKGILCGDDLSWEGVRKAVILFALENNLILTEISHHFEENVGAHIWFLESDNNRINNLNLITSLFKTSDQYNFNTCWYIKLLKKSRFTNNQIAKVVNFIIRVNYKIRVRKVFYPHRPITKIINLMSKLKLFLER
jgi:predicted O-methyltransferase YrrM